MRFARKYELLFPLVISIGCMLIFLRWVPDDAYISIRYARNFSQGLGFVYNPGERVEGFSNPLFTVYVGLASWLGLDPVKSAVATSAAGALASIFLFLRFLLLLFSADEKSLDPGSASRFRVLFLLAFALFFPLIFYATSGMESTAYLALLLLGGTQMTRSLMEKSGGRARGALWIFFIAALLRPEAGLFLLLSTPFAVKRGESKSDLLRAAGPLAAYALVIGAKYLYFGDILPNTYYAKPGVTMGYYRPFQRGAFYLARFFVKSGFVMLLPFALRPARDRRGGIVRCYLWALVLTQWFFIVYTGGDVLRFDRFTLPFYPFYMALAFMGLMEWKSRLAPVERSLAARAAFISLSIVVALNAAQLAHARSKPCIHDWMKGDGLERLGLLLEQTLPDDATVVTNEIGAVGYYSGLRVIDMLGLTDRTIGRIRYGSFRRYGVGSSKESVRAVCDYIFSLAPDCVVIPSYFPLEDVREGAEMHPLWRELYQRILSSGAYDKVLSVRIHGRKHLNVFVRKGVELGRPASELIGPGRCWHIEFSALSP